MLNGVIDLRSDTLTQPTDEMREAMARAVVGDDGYNEDPTVKQLEALAAAKVGKEAALFMPSGTMANLVAMMTHTRHGDGVILEEESHSYYYEVGGLSAVAGLTPLLIRGERGVMLPEDVEMALRTKSSLYPSVTLMCLENPHNRSGGNVIRLEEMAALREVADRHGLAVHLDGARIFNAALALGVDASVIAAYAGSVMFCLSKGLSAPVGSILAGDCAFIQRARQVRQMLGGGMRQVGVIAAAGIVALEKMIDRLHEDHENASLLANRLSRIPGISVEPVTIRTNMLNFDVRGLGMDTAQFLQALARYNIKANGRPPTRVRFVTHRHITREDVLATIEAVKEIAAQTLATR
jgi:threonine aldolase